MMKGAGLMVIAWLLGASVALAEPVSVEWYYGPSGRTDTEIAFSGAAQHNYWIDDNGIRHEWSHALKHTPVLPRPLVGPFEELVEIPWPGCTRITANLRTPLEDLDGDGEFDPRGLSISSNEVLFGGCTKPQPPPVAVPEPDRDSMLLLGLAFMLMLKIGRNHNVDRKRNSRKAR